MDGFAEANQLLSSALEQLDDIIRNGEFFFLKNCNSFRVFFLPNNYTMALSFEHKITWNQIMFQRSC